MKFCDCEIDDGLVAGHVGEWVLSSGDVIERKIRDGQVLYMAVSGDRIVTSSDDGTFSSGHHVIQVFNVSTCLLVLSPYMLFLAMSYVTVERIKQFPDEHVRCHCLSARGDVV